MSPLSCALCAACSWRRRNAGIQDAMPGGLKTRVGKFISVRREDARYSTGMKQAMCITLPVSDRLTMRKPNLGRSEKQTGKHGKGELSKIGNAGWTDLNCAGGGQ